MDTQNLAPTESDINIFQKMLGYAVDFPEAVKYLRDNRTAAALVLTAQNMIPSAKDPMAPREWIGFILIVGGLILTGLTIGLLIWRK